MSLDLALMRPMIERERRLLVAAVLDALPTARSAPSSSGRTGSARRRAVVRVKLEAAARYRTARGHRTVPTRGLR
jgi:hypothetical protein